MAAESGAGLGWGFGCRVLRAQGWDSLSLFEVWGCALIGVRGDAGEKRVL